MSGMNSGSVSMAASVTSNVSSAGRKRDADALLLEGLREDRLPGEHGVERGQPLLAIDDQELRRPCRSLAADLSGAHLGAGLPEHQGADRVSAVHRVEEIPRLRRRPDERPLDVGQRDRPALMSVTR